MNKKPDPIKTLILMLSALGAAIGMITVWFIQFLSRM